MRSTLLAAAALAFFASCRRRPKPAPAAPAAAPPAAVNGEAAAPTTAWLKDASSVPADPIAKVAAGRLAHTLAPGGALSDADKLAAACLRANVACGFELRDDAWARPEAHASVAGATAAQALAAFAGKDYRLAWIGPVAHVFPAAPGETTPLDAEIAADISMNSPAHESAETIRGVALKLGLEMPAPRPQARRKDLIGASTMPVRNSARFVLDALTRPAILRPNVYVVVYRPGGGSLRWFWGEPPAW